MNLLAIVLASFCVLFNDIQTVQVNIPGVGDVIGTVDTDFFNKSNFFSFRGIPYAESPSGSRRFQPPVARQPWNESYQATIYGQGCPVITDISFYNNNPNTDYEDCLSLSVYTKKLDGKLPVMFYIYGGGFYYGASAEHPPHYLLSRDIVLVVPQYRVGALGWAATRSAEIPGNAALADLQFALTWVKDHISAFGGDPNSITVFGQSAGAASVGALLMSPKTPNELIKRAIMQSGSINSFWATNENPQEQAQRICTTLKCDKCATKIGVGKCLQEAPLIDLLNASYTESYAPIKEDALGILPKSFNGLLNDYNKSIPVMLGFTKHDGSYLLGTFYDAMKQKYGDLSNVTVREFASGLLRLADEPTIMSIYLLNGLLFTQEELNGSKHKEAIPAYIEIANDVFFKSSIVLLASKLFNKHLADVYLYTFDYEGEFTRFGYGTDTSHYPFNGGAHHSDDNIYLFSTHQLKSDNDTKIASRMVQLWTTFAVGGQPLSDQNDFQISKMTTEVGPFFHVDSNLSGGDDILAQLRAVKDDVNRDQLIKPNVPF